MACSTSKSCDRVDTALRPDRILELGYAFRGAKALLSAVELGLFTVLADGPRDIAGLTGKAGIAPRGARDFFDALVALGLLERSHDGRYRNTPEADLYLDRGKSTYIGGELEHFNRRVYPAWNRLTQALRTGRPQGGGTSDAMFPSLYADEAALASFADGMTGGSLMAAQALARVVPWIHYKMLVDVGTAQGCLPVQVALAHPHLRATGFDLRQVRPCFERYVQANGLSDRLRFHPGDFLSDPIPKGDVIVLGRVLHNWDLPTKLMLLRKAHEALAPDGCVVIYERLIDDERRVNSSSLLASLHMLIVSPGGFDFTGADCVVWMRDVGFRDMRVEALAAGHSAVIGFK
jgi:SAM-dependent methyltransferase